MRNLEKIGTTDDGTHTPIYFDGKRFWYGCGMTPIESNSNE